MTIDELNALTALTAGDELPVWDVEASAEEPTKKITASNLAASVKSLASLPNTTEMNTAIQQSTANHPVKSVSFAIGNNVSRTITCESALIISVKNTSSDSINGCVVMVSNLGESMKINKIQNAQLIEVSLVDRVLTITNKAGMYQGFIVFYV